MASFFASIQHLSLAAAKNLLVLKAPATHYLEVLEASITNESNETNEQLLCGLYGVTTAGEGAATAITAKPLVIGGSAAAATVEHTYATTEPVLESMPYFPEGMGSLVGYMWRASPGRYLILPPSASVALRIATATFTAFNARAAIAWREILIANMAARD